MLTTGRWLTSTGTPGLGDGLGGHINRAQLIRRWHALSPRVNCIIEHSYPGDKPDLALFIAIINLGFLALRIDQ